VVSIEDRDSEVDSVGYVLYSLHVCVCGGALGLTIVSPS
jgi:hypothetical protein